MYRFAAVALAAAALTCAAAPAAFAADTEEFTVKVKTNDLDLTTEKGARIAVQRINSAASRACSAVTVGSRIAKPDQVCIDNVSTQLIRQLNAPLVQTAFDAQKAQRQG